LNLISKKVSPGKEKFQTNLLYFYIPFAILPYVLIIPLFIVMKHSSKAPLEILHNDDAIVLVNKPAGMLSVPDRYDHLKISVKDTLEHHFGEIYTVHRLDRETSGIMAFARTPEAHKHLNTQFDERSVHKIYHALLSGRLQEKEMEIDIPLMEHPMKKGLMMPSVRGKNSLTILKVLEQFRVAALVECNLRTGRQHQIRVHASAIGNSLLIDKDYGNATEFFLSSIKRKYNKGKHEEERPIMKRLSLHAFSLQITHPVTEQPFSMEASYPKDFRALVQVLKKYSALQDFQSMFTTPTT
jgi:RluA family pseudouridine synthase